MKFIEVNQGTRKLWVNPQQINYIQAVDDGCCIQFTGQGCFLYVDESIEKLLDMIARVS